MVYSQKYTIVQFLGSPPEGTFSMEYWPLHITLADVFAIALSDELLGDLRDFILKQTAFSVKFQDDISLGSEPNKITAIQLENKSELELLHRGLIDLLERNGAVFNTPEYTRDGFLPHCAYQTGFRPQVDAVNLNQLALVDMFVEKDWQKRKVVEIFNLV